MPRSDYRAILLALVQHGVEFIVVGGVGAVLQGAPVNTFDLDVVHRRDAANVERLLAALRALDARYRLPSNLTPNASHLDSPGHQLLTTRMGSLDLRGSAGNGRTYEDLIESTDEIKIERLTVRVLNLETLIALKQHIGREKDLAVLPTLRSALEEKRRLIASKTKPSPSDPSS